MCVCVEYGLAADRQCGGSGAGAGGDASDACGPAYTKEINICETPIYMYFLTYMLNMV